MRYNPWVATSFEILRYVLIVHALSLFAQSVLAGEFLSGTDGVVKLHEWAGWIILGICAVQIAVSALALRARSASLWLLIGTILIFLGEVLQTGVGYGRFMRVHIPLGVIAFAAVSWQTISVFRQSPSVPGSGR